MADLRRDGLAMLPPTATSAIEDLLAYFEQQPVQRADGSEVSLGELAGESTAAYSLQRVLECPGLLALLNAPPILRIMSDYLGCKPTISSLGVRWSFPTDGTPTRTQNFHRDVDDWRFLKLFIYLTDVDEGSGPHCYVRTSHNSAFAWKAKSYSGAELEHRFGPDNLTTVVGPRGTTFIADTLGVHRGAAPISRPRLILQVQYSLLPVFAFLYARPPAQVGVRSAAGAEYCNRLVVG